jgi:c-di-GMP-binding flagellar brake protein YcgR
MERRKFARINMNLAMQYRFLLQDSNEGSTGEGVVKNLSQGGMYFKCPPPLPLEDGNVGDFTIETTPIKGFTSRLWALVKVVRIESPKERSGDFGIAVKFLSNLRVELRS